MRILIIKIDAKIFVEVLKCAGIAHAKDGAYSINITTSKMQNGMNKCAIHCAIDGIQATKYFEGTIKEVKKNENGRETVITEPLNKSKIITVPAFFSEVVYTLAEAESDIFMIIEENIVTLKNKISTVPVPIIDRVQLVGNPKECEILRFSVLRNELLDTLKYLQTGLYIKGKFPNGYGICPVFSQDKAYLDILTSDSYSLVSGDVTIENPPSEVPPSIEKLKYIMLDATKMNQIVASSQDEYVTFTLYLRLQEEEGTVVQVNIACGNGVFQMKPYNIAYPRKYRELIDKMFIAHNFCITLDAKVLKNSLNILALGKDFNKSSHKASLSLVKQNEEFCLEVSDDLKERCTIIKSIKNEGGDENSQINVGVKLLLNALTPFDKNIRIGSSLEKGVITLLGMNSNIKIIVMPINLSEEKTDNN